MDQTKEQAVRDAQRLLREYVKKGDRKQLAKAQARLKLVKLTNPG